VESIHSPGERLATVSDRKAAKILAISKKIGEFEHN
jgi:hypothetical protein